MAANSSGKDAKLTPKQAAFVDEYLIDLNQTQAAIRAGYSPKTANEQACRLLANVNIQHEVSKRRLERQERTQITQDMVLNRWWQIANADPNELISYRRKCCRNCFGEGHKYQWIDEAEYNRAVKDAIDDAKENKTEAVIPSADGGFGFDSTLSPHPKCPTCKGEGYGDVFAKDTRFLSEAGQALYAGVKVTKEGLEIKMQDQGKALENVARHLGMFNDKLTLQGDPEAPLEVRTKVVVVPQKQSAVVEKKPIQKQAD